MQTTSAESIRVLLIEDNPTDVRLVQELLRDAPTGQFTIITASTLAAGLHHLDSDTIDVVLLDLGLPDSQGFDSFHAIDTHAPDVPIVVLTVSTDEELGRRIVLEGAQQFFSKDVLTPDGAYTEMFPRMIRYAIERKRIEAALRRNEAELRMLFEHSPIAQIRYDAGGTPISLNHAAREFLGIDSVGTISHLNIFTSARVSDRDKQRLRAGKPTRYEQTYDFDAIKQDGVFSTTRSGVRYVDFSLAPIFEADGTLKAYLAQVVDITRRKEAESALQESHEELQMVNEELQSTTEELRVANADLEQRVQERIEDLTAAAALLKESEARYRRLVERSFDAVIIHSDGVIRLANEAAVHILKAASPADLVGRNILDIPAPRFKELAKERISAVYKNKQSSQPAEFQYCALDGTTVDVEVMATPITYEDKPAVYVVFRDIGERKRSEEQARAAFLYARSLIEASLDPLVTINAKGRITDVNTATEEVTGYSRDELIGSDFSDYFTEPDNARAGYQQVFTKGFVRDYPLVIRGTHGRLIDVLYNATVYHDEAGEVQGVFAAARDITDRKRAEEELQRYSGHLEAIIEERTAQLKSAERLAGIGETAAMIGHDLRNPLQGLQYIVDLQKLRFERTPPEKRGAEDWQKEQALFDRISEQVFYMDKIVGDLQDYARPIAPDHEEIQLSTIINDALESLPPADGVNVALDVGDLTINGDAPFMHRVFANLFLNAMQAMPHGGMLTIHATTDDGSVAIHVTDTGIGIPASIGDRIFSPLTTGKAKGTGLGLAVVKRIVEAHNGTITYESEEGKGTTFVITLPQTAE